MVATLCSFFVFGADRFVVLSTLLPLSTVSLGLNPSPKGYLLRSGLDEIFSFSAEATQFEIVKNISFFFL
jgi:hypothetical protein